VADRGVNTITLPMRQNNFITVWPSLGSRIQCFWCALSKTCGTIRAISYGVVSTG
jgi:hypothetical protein